MTVADAAWWVAIVLNLGCAGLYTWRIRQLRRAIPAVGDPSVTVMGMSAGLVAVWDGPREEAPHCPRCAEPVAGLFSPSPRPEASVHTIPCDHVLQPDEGMAMRMAVKVND